MFSIKKRKKEKKKRLPFFCKAENAFVDCFGSSKDSYRILTEAIKTSQEFKGNQRLLSNEAA